MLRMAAEMPSEKATSTARRRRPTARLGQSDLRPTYPTSSGDDILEAAEAALWYKAVAMALAGDSTMMRHCLCELSARRMRTAGFTLPEITKTEDLPKATFAILIAAVAGKITFQEAKELSSLTGFHAEAMQDGELALRVAYLEAQQVR